MNRIDRIIIDAEPNDVSQALIDKQNIPSGYELKEFTYTLSKITDKTILEKMDCKEYKITHCRLVLEKAGGSQ